MQTNEMRPLPEVSWESVRDCAKWDLAHAIDLKDNDAYRIEELSRIIAFCESQINGKGVFGNGELAGRNSLLIHYQCAVKHFHIAGEPAAGRKADCAN